MSPDLLDRLIIRQLRRALYQARTASPWQWDRAVSLWFHAN